MRLPLRSWRKTLASLNLKLVEAPTQRHSAQRRRPVLESLEARQMLTGQPTIDLFTVSPQPVAASGNLILNAHTEDTGGNVTSVAFYRDTAGDNTPDVLLGSGSESDGTWTLSVPASALYVGTDSLFADATDDQGATSGFYGVADDVLGALPSGWSDSDIGTPGQSGIAGFNAASSTWTVAGGGADINGASDSFNLVSQSATGDQTLVARVTDIFVANRLTSADPSAKAGVMFRQSGDAGAPFAAVVATPGNGVSFEWRDVANDQAVTIAGPAGLTTPAWVKLVKSGNTFTGYSSADGNSWTLIGSSQVAFSSGSYLAGLAGTAHDNSALDEATFDSVSMDAPPNLPTTLAATPASAHEIDLSWTAPSGGTTTGYNIYRGTTSGDQTLVPVNSTPLASSATTFQDTGLASGSKYFYVVQAVNGVALGRLSVEAAAATSADTNVTPVDLSGSFNETGIVSDGATFASNAGLDFGGTALSANLLGTSQYLGGASYTIGGGTGNNVINSLGQSITLPSGNFSQLRILATGVNGNQFSQTFHVNYTDDTSSSFVVSVSDWYSPHDEANLITMPYRDNYDGSRDNRTFHVYEYDLDLDNSKTVASITLPNNIDVAVFAADLVAAPSTSAIAPTGLTATTSSGAVTLNWAGSTAASGYYVYRGTSSGGEAGVPLNSSPLPADATSFEDSTALAGNTYYYYVRAVNGALLSTPSVEAMATVPAAGISNDVDLSGQYTLTGITSDGTPSTTGGFDAGGYTLSGAQLASTVSWNGIAFSISSTDATNVVQSAGQTITLPVGQYSRIGFLAAAVNGSQPDRTFIVNYADGTSQSFVQGISDWGAAQAYPGESVALSTTYRNTPTGGTDSRSIDIYGYLLDLDSSKTVASITLPNNTNVNLLAIATVGPVAAPTDLTAAAASDTQVTLSWTAPIGTITGYNIFRGTSSGGESIVPVNSTPITASATSYQDVGLTPGNTYYYRVQAINGPGISPLTSEASATPLGDSVGTQVDLGPYFNVQGIATDMASFPGTGLDGAGYALSADQLGVSQTWNNTSFNIGAAGGNNVVMATGQMVSVPAAQLSTLNILATSVNGNQLNQEFTINYTDGTSQTLTQSLSDWASAQGYPGESVAVATAYRDHDDGSIDSRTINVYGYSFQLDSSKIVSSVILPNNANIDVLAVTESAKPAAPSNLFAFSSSSGAVNLSWTAPSGSVSGYDIYRGTAAGAESTTPLNDAVLSASATSYVDTNVSPGVTYYYIVRAATGATLGNASSEATTATPWYTAVDLSSDFNLMGITADGAMFSGGLDGANTALSATQLGTNQDFGSVTFQIAPAGSNNVVQATGQTIALPVGQYSTLQLLGTSVDGNQPDQTFTINYSDGTSDTFTQSMSDWFSPQAYPGESIVAATAYRNLSNGTTDNRTFNVYGYQFNLNDSKTATSITLPSDGDVTILAMNATLAAQPAVQLLDSNGNPIDTSTPVDFGHSQLDSNPATETFTVYNSGTSDLTLDSSTITLPAGFVLVSGFDSNDIPAGASTSFTVAADTRVAGSFAGNVSFSTGDSQVFHFPIQAEVLDGLVTDDSSSDFAAIGGWTTVGQQGSESTYQGGYEVSPPNSIGSVATWTFPGLAPGQYQVLVNWAGGTDRSTNAAYTILDGTQQVGGATLDQQSQPDDLSDAGVPWANIGAPVQIDTGTLVVDLSGAGNGFTVADAVMIRRIAPAEGTIDSLLMPTTVAQGADLTFTAQGVSDSGNVQSVSFYLDTAGSGVFNASTDELLGNTTGDSTGWHLSLSNNTLPVGSDTIFARTNLVGGTFGPAVGAQVIVVDEGAIGSLDAPSSVIQGMDVTLTAENVADAGNLQSVSFYLDSAGTGVLNSLSDTLLGTVTDDSNGWALDVPGGVLPAGPVTIFAQANLTSGPATSYASAALTVTPDGTIGSLFAPPSEIPGQDMTLAPGGLADAGDVQSVAFYADTAGTGTYQVGDHLLGTATSATSYQLTLSDNGFPNGNNTFFAQATLTNGQTGNVVSQTTYNDNPSGANAGSYFVVPGTPGQDVNVSFSYLSSSTAYTGDVIGFYVKGTGQSGDLFDETAPSGTDAPSQVVSIPGGSQVALWIMQGPGNPSHTGSPHKFYSDPTLNLPNNDPGVTHFQTSQSNGTMTFAAEDLDQADWSTHPGEPDYNDMVVSATVLATKIAADTRQAGTDKNPAGKTVPTPAPAANPPDVVFLPLNNGAPDKNYLLHIAVTNPGKNGTDVFMFNSDIVKVFKNGSGTGPVTSGTPFTAQADYWILANGTGDTDLTVKWVDANGKEATPATLKVTAFNLKGPHDVPGNGTYEYTADGVAGASSKFVNAVGGTVSNDQDSNNGDSTDVLWTNLPAIGVVNYQASPQYIWPFQVNVVKVDVTESSVKLGEIPPIIKSDNPTNPNAYAIKSDDSEFRATVVLTGPNGGKGQNEIVAGYIQFVTPTFEATYRDNTQLVGPGNGQLLNDQNGEYKGPGPWIGNLTALSTGATTSEFYILDAPTMSIPQASSQSQKYNLTTGLKDATASYAFSLYIGVATTDSDNGAANVYTAEATYDWKFNASGDPDPYVIATHDSGLSSPNGTTFAVGPTPLSIPSKTFTQVVTGPWSPAVAP